MNSFAHPLRSVQADFVCLFATLPCHSPMCSSIAGVAVVGMFWLPLSHSASSQSSSGIICLLACPSSKSMESAGALPLCSFGLEPVFPSFKEKSSRGGIFWKLSGGKNCLSALRLTLYLICVFVGHEEPSAVDGSGSWADLQ